MQQRDYEGHTSFDYICNDVQWTPWQFPKQKHNLSQNVKTKYETTI